MRNKIRKIVQTDKSELEKCKIGKEFNVDFITYTDTTPKPRKAPVWFQEFVKNEFKPLAVQVKQQGEKLDKVIKLNNLKS